MPGSMAIHGLQIERADFSSIQRRVDSVLEWMLGSAILRQYCQCS